LEWNTSGSNATINVTMDRNRTMVAYFVLSGTALGTIYLKKKNKNPPCM